MLPWQKCLLRKGKPHTWPNTFVSGQVPTYLSTGELTDTWTARRDAPSCHCVMKVAFFARNFIAAPSSLCWGFCPLRLFVSSISLPVLCLNSSGRRPRWFLKSLLAKAAIVCSRDTKKWQSSSKFKVNRLAPKSTRLHGDTRGGLIHKPEQNR